MASQHPTLTQTYCERSYHPNCTPLAVYLLRLMHFKQTNLCVSADVTTTAELLRVAEDTGDSICILKTHADIISDFGERTIRGLNEISRRKKFLVFEDRKFGDIGNTVQQQYVGGPLTIVRWAPIVNCHIFPGPAIITALAQAAQQAISAYNTSVSTDISAGSPLHSAVDDVDDPSEEEDEIKGDVSDATAKSDDEVYEDEYEDNYDARYARKQSVVSVSTTISMKSEAMSPPPSHLHRPSLPRNSISDYLNNPAVNDHSYANQNHQLSPPLDPEPSMTDFSDPGSAADRFANLEHLGPPPYLRSLLLLAQMSSAGNFFSEEYTTACQIHARANSSFVMGFIAQRNLNSLPDDAFVTMTPGVQLAKGGDGKGQQYNTPEKVVGENGADVIIVGRGILAAMDRQKAAEEYRRLGWRAYEERLKRK